jgi:hypothetical protein
MRSGWTSESPESVLADLGKAQSGDAGAELYTNLDALTSPQTVWSISFPRRAVVHSEKFSSHLAHVRAPRLHVYQDTCSRPPWTDLRRNMG